MKNSILKTLTMSLLTLAALICLGGCGAEATGGEEEALTVQEEKALTDEFALEAIETIDENNAEAEADKLAAEIEAAEKQTL